MPTAVSANRLAGKPLLSVFLLNHYPHLAFTHALKTTHPSEMMERLIALHKLFME
jgi:hypothetical protein